MPALKSCARCGAELRPQNSEGFCTRCLLEGGLEASQAETKVPGPGQTKAPLTEIEHRTSDGEHRKARCFGDYELLEEIARGGMGVVYRARQPSLGRIVALKMILAGQFASKQIIQRFRGEVTAAALLQHPNIVAIHDVGIHDGQHFFSMDYVEGQNLSQIVGNRPLPPAKAARYVKIIAEAIHYAHRQGILHRDLKPSNVLVDTSDHPRITDFGLAKRLASDSSLVADHSSLTMTGQMLGSPNFMPPEQASPQRGKVGRPSDVYGLGAILYHLLTARPPFQAESFESVIDQVLNAEPVSPRLLNSSVPPDLETICVKCLQKEPYRRYQSAQELADELGRFLRDEPIHARAVTRAERAGRWCRRNPVVAGLGMALVLTTIAGFLAVAWQAVRARTAEHVATLERRRAERQAELATQEAARATAGASAARRYAYAAEINVAFQALAENTLGRARELLDHQRPKAGEEDLRGFEWRHLWQLCQGDELATFSDEGAHGTAFSPDGKLFAYAGGKITVRETASRKIVTTLPSPATTLSFAPHTKLLASGHDTGVKLWNTERWQEVRSLPDTVHPALFSPDGRWLLTGVAEGFRIWDTQTWQPVGLCAGAPPLRWHSRNAVAFSPDGQSLVTIASEGKTTGDFLRVWRLPGLEALPDLRFTNEPPGSVAFSADGKHVIAGLYDGQLVVWDFATRKVVATRKEHTGWVTAVGVVPDGKTFVTGSSDRTLNLWDATTFKPLVRLRGHIGEVWSAAISPNGRTVVSGSSEATTKLWGSEARHMGAMLDGFSAMSGFIGGGRQLVAVTSNAICVWTPESGARMDFPIPTSPHFNTGSSGKPYSVKPDEPLAALGRSDGAIELWHLTTGAKVAAWPAHENGIGAVAFSSDGKRLVTGSTTGEVKIWNSATRQEVARLGVMGRALYCLAFSPDGKTLASSGQNDFVRLWDVTAGREVLHLGGPDGTVYSVAFSPDGKLLATTTLVGNEACLWELPSGKLCRTLKGHVGGVVAVAFSADGATLVTGGMDRKVKFWNVTTHQELATFPLSGGFPTLGFSPDGRTLAIGNLHEAGRRIQILRAPSFEEIAEAEAKQRDGVNP